MSDSAITALVQLRLRADAVDAARKTLGSSLADTRAFPGCLGARLLVDAADERNLTLVEEWESLAADRAYRKWRAGEGMVADMANLFEGAPTIVRYQKLDG
jgi:quinol monooxygenase YgiN